MLEPRQQQDEVGQNSGMLFLPAQLGELRKNPFSATKGLNLTMGEHLGILQPFLNASSSAEKAVSCSAQIKHCLAACSSSNDKSPFHLSASEDFKFWMKRCNQATTRMAFVKVPHRSSGNTWGTGLHDTNAASTASCDWKEWSSGDSIWSSITQGPSTRNPGPCNHMSEFTNSSAEIPLVTRSAGLSAPGQWDHLSFEV